MRSAGPGFAAQANAVLRSNASLQRRAVWTNLCLLVLPVAFCVLLFALQVRPPRRSAARGSPRITSRRY